MADSASRPDPWAVETDAGQQPPERSTGARQGAHGRGAIGGGVQRAWDLAYEHQHRDSGKEAGHNADGEQPPVADRDNERSRQQRPGNGAD
jgi:hypothetical protein